MFRIWGKIFLDNRLLKDITICDIDENKSRTKKVFDSLREICYSFDIQNPIWLDSNIKDFKRISKTRFNNDNFIEDIEFDFLEIEVIEED